MNTPSSTSDFDYIKEAAELRRRLDLWRMDQKDVREGRLLYAVDTDVVKLFSNPRGKRKYATVFSGDSEDTQEALAWALGHFIFLRLTRGNPLLVIPPHHLEMDRVIVGIARDVMVEEAHISDAWSELESHFRAYLETKNMDRLIRVLEQDALRLLRFAFGGGEGATAELSRITDLFRDERLLHVDRYTERRGKTELPWTLPVLRDDEIPEHYRDLDDLKKSWLSRLRKTKGEYKPKIAVADDAEVLARLEWINRKLAVERNGRRLAIITGDDALRRAASDYRLDEKCSFADCYVRHPQIFFAAPNFLTTDLPHKDPLDPGNPGSFELMNWLDVFFARYEPGRPDYKKRLKAISALKSKEQEALVRDFTADAPQRISELQDKWTRFVRSTMVDYGFDSDRENKSIQRLVRNLEQGDLETIREQVDKRVSEVRTEFWGAAVIAGYRATGAKNAENHLPRRGVPALRITLQPACDYVIHLCRTLDHQPLTERDPPFDELIDELKEKGQDPSGYTGFLVFALAFGAAGRWGAVEALASRALQIADREARNYEFPEGHEPITGNEAAYLLAWAIRHDAHKATRLEKARRYLKEAETRRPKATDGEGSDIRYRSEDLALDLAYHNFRLFCPEQSKSIPPDLLSLAECQNKALYLLDQVGNEKEEYIRVTVEKQLLTHLFPILFLRTDKEGEDQAVVENGVDTQKWLKRFEDVQEWEGHKTKTCMTRPIYLLATSRYGTPEQKEECTSEAKEFFDRKTKQCFVMHYDEPLYHFLKSICPGISEKDGTFH